jgi:hypothetical protein
MTSPSDRKKPEKPLPRHAAARVTHARAAADISDYAAAVVPTSSDRLAQPGEFITQARQARKLALTLLVCAVLLERALGHSWKQIAHAFGYPEEQVRAQYEPVEQAWLSELRGVRPLLSEPVVEMSLFQHKMPVTDAEIRDTAAMLDEWCRRRQDLDYLTAGDNSPGPRLVSDGLAG